MVQLKEGNFYRTVDGRKVGPIEKINGDMYYGHGVEVVSLHGGRTQGTPQKYNPDGTVFMPRAGEENDQIVAEWGGVSLKMGDVVQLKSGGEYMTVRGATAKSVTVEWLGSYGTPYQASYHPDMLEVV